MTDSIQKQFTAALDELIAQVKQDRSILAAILCGSLAHDTVWTKSDIDLALVTVDDKRIAATSLALYAAGINVHTFLIPRADFRKTVEGSIRNSVFHSLLAKGRLLYTHDETILDLCARLREMGERDTQVQILTAATHALNPMDKARKWFVTRGDLDYTALWILYAATPLAQIVVLRAGLLVDREVIPQAMKLNPSFFGTIYTNLLNARKTRKHVEMALETAEKFIAEQASTLFAPVIDHLRAVGEARSASEIEAHFKRNFNIGGLTSACEYLVDLRLLAKASIAVQLTKRSNISVEELAFAYTGEPLNGW